MPPQVSQGAPHGDPPAVKKGGANDQRGRLIGRTKGGMNTRLHAVTDADGRPIRFFMAAGEVSDDTGAAARPTRAPGLDLIVSDQDLTPVQATGTTLRRSGPGDVPRSGGGKLRSRVTARKASINRPASPHWPEIPKPARPVRPWAEGRPTRYLRKPKAGARPWVSVSFDPAVLKCGAKHRGQVRSAQSPQKCAGPRQRVPWGHREGCRCLER